MGVLTAGCCASGWPRDGRRPTQIASKMIRLPAMPATNQRGLGNCQRARNGCQSGIDDCNRANGDCNRAVGDICAVGAWADASRTIEGTTETAAACCAALIWASSSLMVGRPAGLRLKHRRTMSAYVGGRVAGRETASDAWSGHAGGIWVSASTMTLPRPQISPAAELLPSLASGGSYKEFLAVLAVGWPAGRMLSLASFS